MTSTDVLSHWRHVGSVAPTALVDSRLQLHHALQIIVSAPISFLEKRPDDSHTNLEWLPSIEALGTNWLDRAQRIRFALCPAALSLLAVDRHGSVTSDYALDGRSTADAVAWLRESLAAAGYDSAALTTKKHYEIPPHAVASGHAYARGSGESLAELGRYYGNAHEVASYVATTRHGASSVRCWPHHFDLATLITLPEIAGRGARTIGVGLSPGDDLYAEPYFYEGPNPQPSRDRLRPLGSLGSWHTEGWVGAVLRGSELSTFDDARRQGEAVRAFADAAIDASIEALS